MTTDYPSVFGRSGAEQPSRWLYKRQRRAICLVQINQNRHRHSLLQRMLAQRKLNRILSLAISPFFFVLFVTNTASSSVRDDSSAGLVSIAKESKVELSVAEDPTKLGNELVTQYQPQLGCRSGWSGENDGLVRQVRQQIDTIHFSHIETSFWPTEQGKAGLVMMFWSGNTTDELRVREAYAVVDPKTCHAKLTSVT